MHHHGWLIFFAGVITLGVAIALTHKSHPQPPQRFGITQGQVNAPNPPMKSF